MKGCKLHMMNSSFMDRLPSNIILDIFSRVPVKYLARSRCVSKVWCKYIDDPYLVIIYEKRVVEPTPILYHQHLSPDRMAHIMCFHVIESKQSGTTDYVLDPKKGPFFEYFHKKPLSKYSMVRSEVQCSCIGLICLSEDNGHVMTSLAVVHPLRKECYELPLFPLRFRRSMRRESCGLGFDASTNTWKMVCVLLKKFAPPQKPNMVKKNLCTMVHVFGTNSWREIPQVPAYPISGKAVFANGFLHWLASYCDIKSEDGGGEVIWFDVNKEEFGAIKGPKRMCDLLGNYSYYDQVVDLNGEVGYVCCRTMEIWVLNMQKEWVPHCRFEKDMVPDGFINVIGCLNKDGDILMTCRMKGGNGMYIFFVYNLKSGVLHKTSVAGREGGPSPDIFMYPNTLSSIHGMNTNSFSMKKPDLKKITELKRSCRDSLSLC